MRIAGLTPADVRRGLQELANPGGTDLPGPALWRIGFIAVALVTAITHLIGAGIVLFNLVVITPLPPTDDPDHVRAINTVAAVGYMLFAIPAGTLLAPRALGRVRRWMQQDRPATPQEQRELLHGPLRLAGVQVGFWTAGAVGFGVLNATFSVALGIRVALVVWLAGMVTAACAYLFTERILRGAAARALATGMPDNVAAPGVATRALAAWALGTGVPVVGLIIEGVLASRGELDATVGEFGVSVVALGGIAISVGLLANVVAARTTADPVDAVTAALAKVEEGSFDVRVPVYDGTELGRLQLGFNRMVAGLAERERIRRAFGTYVDPEVADHILERGGDADVEGSDVDVTIMFVDVRDFTRFAEQADAHDVVTTLNRLFDRIVPIIHDHAGRVDKFVGDGLLAVFGAPRPLDDHADRALAAALAIDAAVLRAGEVAVGIGLNSGMVVAGNIGTDRRREYGVIGDAVNVAARIEAATRETGDRVLLSDDTRRRLRGDHALAQRPDVALKGKRDPVTLWAPA